MNALTAPAENDNSWLHTQTLNIGSTTAVAATTDTYNALGELTDLANNDGSGATLSDYGRLA